MFFEPIFWNRINVARENYLETRRVPQILPKMRKEMDFDYLLRQKFAEKNLAWFRDQRYSTLVSLNSCDLWKNSKKRKQRRIS